MATVRVLKLKSGNFQLRRQFPLVWVLKLKSDYFLSRWQFSTMVVAWSSDYEWRNHLKETKLLDPSMIGKWGFYRLFSAYSILPKLIWMVKTKCVGSHLGVVVLKLSLNIKSLTLNQFWYSREKASERLRSLPRFLFSLGQ